MILRDHNEFYIEHGTKRKGWFNSKSKVFDKGKKDRRRKAVYATELEAERLSAFGFIPICDGELYKYLIASVIDIIVTKDEYVEWFGSTSLLIKFSKSRDRSRAWINAIEFATRDKVSMFDIYHELAHTVTLRNTEPNHGERFLSAYLLIASLSPFDNHAQHLVRQLNKRRLYPLNNTYLLRELDYH